MGIGRFGRKRKGRRAGERRHGAVLVMTTAAMAGLMVVSAVAVDLSRLFVIRTELQTAADAAALAAARQLNADRTRAGFSALSAAQANRAMNAAVDVDSVRFGVWRASDHTFVRTSSPLGADAAQVTVGRTSTYLLARVLSSGPVRVTARATAWAGAPAMRSNCVTPWFILHADYMQALGKQHWDLLSNDDVRALRDTATNKRWLTVRLRNVNKIPVPGNFYGMVLPSHNSGDVPQPGGKNYLQNITKCTTMERGWVAETEQANITSTDTWTGLKNLCPTLAGGVCYNSKGGVGVPVTINVFCTGPEHTGGDMWFEVEWLTGFMVTGGRQTSDGVEVTGYLTPSEGSGEIRADEEATGLVRTILVR